MMLEGQMECFKFLEAGEFSQTQNESHSTEEMKERHSAGSAQPFSVLILFISVALGNKLNILSLSQRSVAREESP